MHCSVNISKKLPKHKFMIENKCFYLKQQNMLGPSGKLQRAHTVYQTMRRQHTSITQF